jgi:hypothetical protein
LEIIVSHDDKQGNGMEECDRNPCYRNSHSPLKSAKPIVTVLFHYRFVIWGPVVRNFLIDFKSRNVSIFF